MKKSEIKSSEVFEGRGEIIEEEKTIIRIDSISFNSAKIQQTDSKAEVQTEKTQIIGHINSGRRLHLKEYMKGGVWLPLVGTEKLVVRTDEKISYVKNLELGETPTNASNTELTNIPFKGELMKEEFRQFLKE